MKLELSLDEPEVVVLIGAINRCIADLNAANQAMSVPNAAFTAEINTLTAIRERIIMTTWSE